MTTTRLNGQSTIESAATDTAAKVATTPVRELTIIVLRGTWAVTLPAILFSALAGGCGGIAVQVFRFVTSF